MKTVKSVLEWYTEEQLAPILKLWGLTGELDKKKPQQIDSLIKHMHHLVAAHFVWEYITEDERQILYRILPPSTREGITQDKALIKRTQLTPERFEIALQKLVEKALLQKTDGLPRRNIYYSTTSTKTAKLEKVITLAAFSESAESLYATSREYFTPSGDRSKWNLDRLLTMLPYGGLDKLLSYYGVSRNAPYGQGLNTLLLSDQLIDMEEPLDHLPNLDPIARKLFVWLREHNGKETMEGARTFLQVDDATLLKTLTLLTQHALVFDSFSKGERVLFVPSDWYSNMRPLTTNAKLAENEGKLIELEGEPAAALPGENITVYDIATLVNTIYQQTIEPTQAGRVPKRIATKIRPTLRGKPRLEYDDSDDYMEMLLKTIEYLTVIQLTEPAFQDMKPAYEVTPSVEQWAKKSLFEQTTHLLAYWIENYTWRDVYGINYSSWSTYSWDFAGGRKALLKHLHKCTPRRWYTVESLLQKIWKDDAFAYRPTPSYNRTKKQVKDYETHVKWDRCEGEVYRGILASTLYELGIVDIGYTHADALSSKVALNPDYFQVTELGGRIMTLVGSSEKFVEEVQTAQHGLVIQPNFELLLLQPDMVTLYDLLPFAQAKQLGLVSTLTLTKASVLRGLQAGKNVEQILQTLQERSLKDVPQNVEYTIRDWTRTYKSTKLSQVLLFEVSSEDAGQILAVIPALQDMGVRQLAPCIFAVSGIVDLQAMRKELEKAGVFVHISGDIFTRPKHLYDPYFATYGRYY